MREKRTIKYGSKKRKADSEKERKIFGLYTKPKNNTQRDLWNSSGITREKSIYEKIKDYLEPMHFSDILKYSERLLLNARSNIKSRDVNILNGLSHKIRTDIVKSLSCSSDNKSLEYIGNLSKEQLIEYTANLMIYILPHSREFDVNEYFKNLFKGNQSGRAYRSFREH